MYSGFLLISQWFCVFLSAACRCEVRHQRHLQPWTEWQPLHTLHRHHTCSYMKRGEKPEGYRQMRPKTFPASNYSGNSQHMLQEIRNSLRNLSKPSDPPKVDVGGPGKMPSEDPRQQGRSSNPKHPYHKALQEIRKSLLPFANEPSISGPETNKHMSLEPPCAGFEEVRWQFFGFICHRDMLLWRIVEMFHSKDNSVIENNHSVPLFMRKSFEKLKVCKVEWRVCTGGNTKLVSQLPVVACFEPVCAVQVWSVTLCNAHSQVSHFQL